MVYLCGRPLPNRGRCVLGRETAIQPMRWAEDGWLYAASGDSIPVLEIPTPHSDILAAEALVRADFDDGVLPIDFQWLRSPEPHSLFSLTDRPGHLRLHGRETLGSLFEQALVARRQQAFCYSAAAMLEFDPQSFQQAAGLICYYNGSKFHYLFVTAGDQGGRQIQVMSALPDSPQADAFSRIHPIAAEGRIELRAEVDYERLRFAFRIEGEAEWTWLSEPFDASILSDEASAPGLPNFTGAFVGMACQDVSGRRRAADFDWFDYRERAYVVDPTAAVG